MNIKLEKADLKYLSACEEALKNSLLGQKYFSKEGSALAAVKEGIEKETLYLALKDEEFIGFIYYIPYGAFHGYPYIHLLVIKEEYRNMGYGKKVMDLFEQMLFKSVDKIFLVVADFNLEAKNFYQDQGYIQVGEIPDLYRPGITEYLMMKTNPKNSKG